MRIVGGKYKGRVFKPPMKKWPTRPTTDFAKEGLFNILQNHIDFTELKALDLFAGTGSISFELLSRGVQSLTLVEKHGPCLAFIKDVLEELDPDLPKVKRIKKDVLKYLSANSEPYNFVFADPPYDFPKYSTLLDLVIASSWFTKDALFVLEHDKRNEFDDHQNLDFKRNYGNVIFSFFRPNKLN